MSVADTIHARCRVCGEVFAAPADAAEHYFGRDGATDGLGAGHKAWSLPLAWLRQADVLTPGDFFAWSERAGKPSI